MAETGTPCVFFDRDGIVNVSPGPGYVERWEDFHLVPEFPAVLRAVLARGYAAVIVTNQRGVALGTMSAGTVEDIHARLRAVLREQHGVDVRDILYCPHERDTCTCRKPQPGMLLEAASRYGLDLAASWMVGDHARDVEAGRRAGCRTILVGGVPGAAGENIRVADMGALLERIEAGLLEA
jgi:D-glycero-D-manno-heptose 1,7-bisphosphate phosphatase